MIITGKHKLTKLTIYFLFITYAENGIIMAMVRKRSILISYIATVFITVFVFCPFTSNAASVILKYGMEGSEVKQLQKNLQQLGYFNAEPTGYFGDVTLASVRSLQKKNSLDADGIVGKDTYALISRLIGFRAAAVNTSGVLKEGMEGSLVVKLQNDLSKLGFFDHVVTGYFGTVTTASVRQFQKARGIGMDGIVGKVTSGLISELVSALGNGTAAVDSSAQTGNKFLRKWFGDVDKVFAIGMVAEVYDILTGRTFMIKRTYGENHADCETVTSEDTAKMKQIYGGDWTWSRRQVIISFDGIRLAASMAGLPHAGNEDYPANRYVSSRSGGYSGGENLDSVKGNNMSGHFDVHFLNSRTHGTNKVDVKHQETLMKAAQWAEKNLK